MSVMNCQRTYPGNLAPPPDAAGFNRSVMHVRGATETGVRHTTVNRWIIQGQSGIASSTRRCAAAQNELRRSAATVYGQVLNRVVGDQ